MDVKMEDSSGIWINQTFLNLDKNLFSESISLSPPTDNFTKAYKNLTTLMNQQQQQQSWIHNIMARVFPLYLIIFLLAVVGNGLVILTLVHNKRMRTVTNLFLLNLAISDLLLGIFCMPFTLVGLVLRDFIFGEIMCKLLPYLQASSVSVSAWTLVAISVERYYAICHPLRSRQWQTLKHAYKLIIAVWLVSLSSMLPIAILSTLIPTGQGHNKCRELWPDEEYEKIFNLLLLFFLLVLPLFVMLATYFMISRTLWQGIRMERELKDPSTNYSKCLSKNSVEVYLRNGSTKTRCSQFCGSAKDDDAHLSLHQIQSNSHDTTSSHHSESLRSHPPNLRRSNAEKSLLNKKRVIKMLFVVVLEFFLCWTPLYIINTIALFEPRIIYQNLGYTAISFLQLMAYSSSCCNPITYCFMSHGFRKAFLNLFRCFRQNHQPTRRVSLSCYAPPSNATMHLHPYTNDNENGNNNVDLLNNSNSEQNLDLSRQHSYRIQCKSTRLQTNDDNGVNLGSEKKDKNSRDKSN